ncbi:hypothetical protein FNO01nite_17300 [Flavobacterium noncentrifugens]|uniref:Nucleotide-binding universal stress protein, UspA family n=1 Tax=Flavobacterium noncentrifugens TaxID=1128970 RepID=A0A1G8WV13_9FLAO|nr:universal stress protein [Flavobacterium noncentrifugens]GEP51058.1 hypothetical protein FNO01nite_17300 [Flavobacterium noncentrifugens]SDJ81896.1 Nucleotide-binding universal stress protein, UspA family [Flavobacterium noncentrifugens]
MKKILVTTDFSNNSKAGIRFAIQLASQSACELIFYHVDDRSDFEVWTESTYNQPESFRNAGQQKKLREFVSAIYEQEERPQEHVDWIIDNKPLADDAIVHYAKKIEADCICMSTRGGGTIDKFLGTNASALIATSNIPLLIIPHAYRSKPMETLLYASDFENLEVELKAIEKFTNQLHIPIQVFHYDYNLEDESVKKRLDEMALKNQRHGITFHFKKFHAELSLLSHLQKDIHNSRPSIIAMFTKQDRNWFEQLFLSSKTAELGFDTKTPLLVFKK